MGILPQKVRSTKERRQTLRRTVYRQEKRLFDSKASDHHYQSSGKLRERSTDAANSDIALLLEQDNLKNGSDVENHVFTFDKDSMGDISEGNLITLRTSCYA